ncbi:Ribonuclease H domain [Sesbania bispinosa]|nr:Ribonuclease H domain [Sesbania bispinosa]
MQVKDLWENGAWSLSSLATPLNQFVLEAITSLTPPPSFSDAPNTWIWAHCSDGIYTPKSGYTCLQEHHLNPFPSRPWRLVWKAKAPDKVRFTIWLALHNSLPTKSVLHHRGMGPDDTCPRCHTSPETIIHCLRDCEYALAVWRRVGFNIHNSSFDYDLLRWLEDTHLQAALEPAPSFSSAAFWWSCPPAGFSKLNVDGSFNPVSRAMGIGGVLRESDGNWLWGFSDHRAYGSVLEAELLAIQVGLQFAWEQNHRCVLCETDSLEVIHLLNDDRPCSSSTGLIGLLLGQIKVLLQQPWEVHLSHILREANSLVDFLSKFSSRRDRTSLFWKTPPGEVLDILSSDSSL